MGARFRDIQNHVQILGLCAEAGAGVLIGEAHMGLCRIWTMHFFWGCVGSHVRAKSTNSPASSRP